MPDFSRKMPFAKTLSYAFARVCGRDVLCSRMVCTVHQVAVRSTMFFTMATRPDGNMNVHAYRWFEARPVKGEAGLYSLTEHVYFRNERKDVSGDHEHREFPHRKAAATAQTGDFYTRDEVEQLMRDKTAELLNMTNAHAVENMPLTLRSLSVHRARAASR